MEGVGMFELPCRGWVHLLQKLLVDWLLSGAEHPQLGEPGTPGSPHIVSLFLPSAPVCRHLPFQHSAVQVPRGHGRG